MAQSISIRSLQAMKARWQSDLDRFEAVYPVTNWEAGNPHTEVIRNIATAIAQIDGVITGRNYHPDAD